MKVLCIVVLLAVCTNVRVGNTQDARNGAAPSVSLDQASFEEVKSALSAKPPNEADLLFTAMHNKDYEVEKFCLVRVGEIERVQQARLLSRIFLDKTIIVPFEDVGEGWTAMAQARRQVALRQWAYKLFGRTPNYYSDVLTSAEIKSLVAELDGTH